MFEKVKIKLKESRKLRIGLVACVAVLVAVGGAGGWFLSVSGKENDAAGARDAQQDDAVQEGAENELTAEGTTQISTVSQLPEFTVDAAVMTVAEVYVEAGSTVKEGDALYRLDAESIEEAAAYYEEAIADAKEAVEQAELAYETGALEAEYTLQETKSNAENAQANYDASMSALDVTVEEKRENYESAIVEIQGYQKKLDNNTYYTELGIEEKQTAVTAAEQTYTERQAAVTTAQASYDAAKAAVTADMENLKTQINSNASYEELLALTEQTAADYETEKSAADALTAAVDGEEQAKSALDMANQTLSQAQKEYDTKVAETEKKITELTDSLEGLREASEAAERENVTKEANIKKTYDDAVLAGKYADAEYEQTIAELESAVEEAQENLDELMEEQEVLLALNDGVVTAAQAGTIAAVTYGEGDTLYKDVALVSYYDTQTVQISVEIPQEDIAKLAVGDEAAVTISGSRGNVTGTIASIASSKTSGGSMSEVTYAVVISIDNTEGRISSGQSAVVTFSEEQLKNKEEAE